MFGEFLPNGVWYFQAHAPPLSGRPGLILDRDGVVVHDVGYLSRPEDVSLNPGIIPLLAKARAAAMRIGVATNQSGIARGLFGWKEFWGVERRIDQLLAEQGIEVDLRVACPFHPSFTPNYGEEEDHWRKPGPGMLLFACKRLGLAAERTWMIGDKAGDIEAARRAGLRAALFLFSNEYGRQETDALSHATVNFTVASAPDLVQASSIVGL